MTDASQSRVLNTADKVILTSNVDEIAPHRQIQRCLPAPQSPVPTTSGMPCHAHSIQTSRQKEADFYLLAESDFFSNNAALVITTVAVMKLC